jgi:hypothetical protein
LAAGRRIRKETLRVLRSVPADKADAGTLIDEGVRGLFTGQTGSPSQVGIALMGTVGEVINEVLGNPHQQTVTGSVLYGCWLREFAERDIGAVPPFPLPLGLPLTPSGRIDYDRWGEDDPVLRQVKLALIDNVRKYGGSDEAFEWMPIDVLNVVFALAAWWVHENESPRGGAAKEMNIEAVASCVRAGYGAGSS